MSNTTTSNPAGMRIAALLDSGSFVEIGGAVTARTTDFNMQEKETPADGVITGYGVIDGNLVYVYSQDATVLKGAIGEMHARKIAHIYDMAMKMGAPVIGLIDCAGMRLQEATDALNAFGSLYYKQAMASGVIPQITAIFGNCGGGLATAAALTDFTFMETKGRLFVNSLRMQSSEMKLRNVTHPALSSRARNPEWWMQSEQKKRSWKISVNSYVCFRQIMRITILMMNVPMI